MYTVRNTGEHMYSVIQKDGSDKYIILGATWQAQEIVDLLNKAVALLSGEQGQEHPIMSLAKTITRRYREGSAID